MGAAAAEKSVEGESPARAAVIGLPEERAGASVAANPMQLGPPVAGLAVPWWAAGGRLFARVDFGPLLLNRLQGKWL